MHLYERFCRETVAENGRLTQFQLDYPENFNFGYDVVDAMADLAPQQRALVWCNGEGQEEVFTFADLRRKSNQAARVLRRAGIGRGDHVMVALKRHYEYWFVAVALHKLGAVLIPVTHMLTEQDILYRLNCSPVRAILCTPQNQVPDRMAGAVAQAGLDCRLFTVQEDVPGFVNLTRAMAAEAETLERLPTRAADPMILYFTSGTTGQPKGVVHDFTYPLAHIITAKYWQRAQDGGLHFTVAETGWGKASWGKIYGQWLVGSAVMVFDFDNFDPKRLVAVINRYGVTSFCAPPTVYRYLVKKTLPPMPTLRFATTAGEQLNPEVFRQFTQATGLPLMEGYGQTETTLLLANFAGWAPVPGAMGVPSPLYRVQLQNADGTPTPVGEVGEIVVLPQQENRPVGLFSQYLQDPARYEQVWAGGVYHTGDAAWQDENGSYWFHGRFDDIIKTGGFRVGPYEVENVLMEHPAVLECSVIGVPDPLRGQAIQAVVVPAAGCVPGPALEREIREFCNSRMAEYKWIRKVEFVPALPKTISGKIRKTELRTQRASKEEPGGEGPWQNSQNPSDAIPERN